jgi:flagellar motor switch protein FliM
MSAVEQLQEQPPAAEDPSPEHPVSAAEPQARVRTVDFSQPTKFTVDLRRRIVRGLGPFCETFALRLSSELRAPVELSVADANQLTWAAAKAQLPAPSIGVALDVAPVEGKMLLGIEMAFVLRALECLLGGRAQEAPIQERALSEIDWALTKRMLGSLVGQLSQVWRDLGGLQLALGEVDLEGEAGVLAPIGEPTFAVSLAASIDGLPAALSLLIPWSAVQEIAQDIAAGLGGKPEDSDPRQRRAMQRGLASAHVLLRAEVGSTTMPVAQMLALRPGQALTLADRAEHGVRLFAEGVPLGHARPGLRGAKRAVKLTVPLSPGHAPSEGAGTAGEPVPTRSKLARMLGVPVRVWAELGRTTVPLRDTLELPPGTVVELDQGAQAPIELYVNGLCFAHGSLQVAAAGEWAVRVDRLV